MSVADPRHTATPTYGDVNRDVLATLRPPGNLYFAWMSIVGLLLMCFLLAWTYQIFVGMGSAGKRVPQMRRPLKRYTYAVRICPEPVHWGGLSGCDYSESVSWGKIVPRSEGGRWAEVKADATIAWPLVVKAVMERVGDKRKGGTAGNAAPVQRRGRSGAAQQH